MGNYIKLKDSVYNNVPCVGISSHQLPYSWEICSAHER